MEQEHKKSFLKTYVATAAISLVVGLSIFSLDFFTKKMSLLDACNACALGGIVLICLAGLIYVARLGFFDFAAYGFKQLGSILFSKKANEHNDFVSYREQQNVVRENRSKYYVVVTLVGVAFVTAFIILRIILLNYVPLN